MGTSHAGPLQRLATTDPDTTAQRAAQALGPQGAQLHAMRDAAHDGPGARQLKALSDRLNGGATAQRHAMEPVQRAARANGTGLPDGLKSGIESLSGMSMDQVKVHYNSSEPAQLNAAAYTQGTDIRVAPGQEQHLAHEAWHVVQQAQGRVKPTTQMGGTAINDDKGLEAEADRMGAQAISRKALPDTAETMPVQRMAGGVAQRVALPVTVTGVTHLVIAQHGSIMDGIEADTLEDGAQVTIETTQKMRSRRGPNQEIYEERDRPATHDYRWFRVLGVGGRQARGDVYIRDATFQTDQPQALGAKPAVLGNYGRDRIRPEVAQSHAAAAEIVAASKQIGGTALVENLVRTRGLPRSAMNQVRLLQLAYAFGHNAAALAMARHGQKDALLMIAHILQPVTGGGSIYVVASGNLVEDLQFRTLGWPQFLTGIDELRRKPQALDAYLTDVLDHDKGYPQTLESASRHFMHAEKAEKKAEAPKFADMLGEALAKTSSNTTLWGEPNGARKSNRAQLEAGPQVAGNHDDKETTMWQNLVTALVTAGGGSSQAQALTSVFDANREALFARIRELVPMGFALDARHLRRAIYYGYSPDDPVSDEA